MASYQDMNQQDSIMPDEAADGPMPFVLVVLGFVVIFMFGASYNAPPTIYDTSLQAGVIAALAFLVVRFYKKKSKLNLWRKLEVVLASLALYMFWFITIGGPSHVVRSETRAELWLNFSLCFLVLIPFVIVHALAVFLSSSNGAVKNALSPDAEREDAQNEPKKYVGIIADTAPDAGDVIFCSQCGTRCKTSSNFCHKCGYGLDRQMPNMKT